MRWLMRVGEVDGGRQNKRGHHQRLSASHSQEDECWRRRVNTGRLQKNSRNSSTVARAAAAKQNEARPCVSKQRQQTKRQRPTSGRRASRCRGKLCSRARAADRERAWGAADCAVAAVSPKLRSREKHAGRATAAAPAQEIGPSDQRPTLHPHHRTSYGRSASNPLSRPSLAPSPPPKALCADFFSSTPM